MTYIVKLYMVTMVTCLLQLDKVYDPNAPEDDMMERYEEMNRMREHVMNEVDQDKDKLISLKEFMESTRGDEFEKDEGWEVNIVTIFNSLPQI